MGEDQRHLWVLRGLTSKRSGVSLVRHVVGLPDEFRSDGAICDRTSDETTNLGMLGVNREVLDSVDDLDERSNVLRDGVRLGSDDLGLARNTTDKSVKCTIERSSRKSKNRFRRRRT